MWAKLKKAWRSWTVWTNGIVALVIYNLDSIAAFFPPIQPYISAGIYAKAMIGLAIVNLMLRFKTNKSLEDK